MSLYSCKVFYQVGDAML